MNHNLAFDFIVNKENNTITVRREFAAELALVWNAYTQSEILDQWWAPKPWKARTKKMDFREGGSWLYAMISPEGEEHWGITTCINIIPHKKYTGTDAFADSNGVTNPELPHSTWEVNFTSKGQHTVVETRIAYPDLEQLETTIKMGFKEGLTMCMENLDELLLTLKK